MSRTKARGHRIFPVAPSRQSLWFFCAVFIFKRILIISIRRKRSLVKIFYLLPVFVIPGLSLESKVFSFPHEFNALNFQAIESPGKLGRLKPEYLLTPLS
jgi:hypothetical protein